MRSSISDSEKQKIVMFKRLFEKMRSVSIIGSSVLDQPKSDKPKVFGHSVQLFVLLVPGKRFLIGNYHTNKKVYRNPVQKTCMGSFGIVF